MYPDYRVVEAYHQQRYLDYSKRHWARRQLLREAGRSVRLHHAVVNRVGAALVRWGQRLQGYGAARRSVPRIASK